METIKERIVHFIDYLHISQRRFLEKINVSHAFLTTNGSVGSNALAMMMLNYPELNIEWLISGVGEMIKSGPDRNASLYKLMQEEKINTAQAESDMYKKKYFEALELFHKCQAELNK